MLTKILKFTFPPYCFTNSSKSFLDKYSPIIPVKAILYPSKQPSFPWGGIDDNSTSWGIVGTLITGAGVVFFLEEGGGVFFDLTNAASSSSSSSSSWSSSVRSSSRFVFANFFGGWVFFSGLAVFVVVSPKKDPTPPLI